MLHGPCSAWGSPSHFPVQCVRDCHLMVSLLNAVSPLNGVSKGYLPLSYLAAQFSICIVCQLRFLN